MTRKHGGRVAIDPTLRRSERLTTMVRPGDLDDLVELARAWNVSTSAAAWAILADYLASLRAQPPALGTVGLDLVEASRRILSRTGHAPE